MAATLSISSQEELYHVVDKNGVQYLFYTLIGYNFISGFYLAGVTSLFPEMEEALGISNAILGDLVATSVVGISLAIYFTPLILTELGSASSTLYSALLAAAGLTVYGFGAMYGEWMLVVGINIVGFAFVWLGGSCNTQVSLLELIEGKPMFGFMQGIHALGILSGALVSAGLSQLNVTVYAIDILFSILLLLVVLIPLPYYIRHDAEVRLELHREEVKERVAAERRRLLSNVDTSSSDSDDDRGCHPSSHPSGPESHLDGSGQSDDADDPEIAPTSDSERTLPRSSKLNPSSAAADTDAAHDADSSSFPSTTVDHEHRPLLRSRNGGSSSCSSKQRASSARSEDNSKARGVATTSAGGGGGGGGGQYGTVLSPSSSSSRDVTMFVLLNCIMVCAGLGSGVALSWSEIYVLQDWSTSETVATLGYVGFQLGAAISRFMSDWMLEHFSRKALVMYGCFGAGLGTLTSALACLNPTDGTLVVAVLGFIMTGFFFGPIYPAILGYATTLRGYPTGEALPVVKASTLIAGMVIAPLLFGNIIDLIGYMWSFLIQVVIYGIGFACAWRLRSDRRKRPRSMGISASAGARTVVTSSGGSSGTTTVSVLSTGGQDSAISPTTRLVSETEIAEQLATVM
jgi:MFS family permease